MNSNVNYGDMTVFEKLLSLPTSMYVFMVAIPIIIGLVVVFLLVKFASGKTTTDFRTYAPMGGEIISARDRYTHSTETRVKIQKNNGGGGGHGGGFGGHGGGGHRGGGHRGGGHR